MSDTRLGRSHRGDFAWIEMNAVTQNRFWRKQSALFVNMRVIARSHEMVMHFFNFFAILSEVSLQVSVEAGS